MPKDLSGGYKVSQEDLLISEVRFELDDLLSSQGWYVREGDSLASRYINDRTCLYSLLHVVDFHPSTKYGCFLGARYKRSWFRQYAPDEGDLWCSGATEQLVCYCAPYAGHTMLFNCASLKGALSSFERVYGYSRNRKGTDYTEIGALIPWEAAKDRSIRSLDYSISPDLLAKARQIF